MAADTRDIFAWRKRDASKPPPMLKYRSAKWFIMTTICIAVFTDVFLYGIIVPVIPFALSTRAGVPEADVQHWVSVLLACYGAALLAAAPICGWFADHSKSRRAPLLIGLVALAGATVMLLVGSSIGVLVAGRLLQGFSAAVVWTVGLALLVDTVGQKDVGQVMGYVSLSMSLSILLAPLLGGVVYARAGYFAVYYMAFGLIALDVILRVALIEKKIAKQWDMPIKEGSAVDLPSMAGVPPGSLTSKHTSLADSSPASTTPPTTPFKSSNLERPISVPADPQKKRLSLPPVITLLGSRRLLASLWGCLVQASLLTAFDSVLPLRVQAVFHWSSTGAGLIFLALILPSFIAPFIGYLSDKSGPRWLAAGGFVLACPFLVLLRLVDHDSMGQKVLLCALLALLGAALTMVMTPLLAEITYVVEAKEKKNPAAFGAGGAYAQAYGLFNVAFAGGSLVGPIWAGFVEQRAGWGTMSWTLGLLSAVSAVPVVVYSGGLITKRHRETKRWGHEEEGKDDEVTASEELDPKLAPPQIHLTALQLVSKGNTQTIDAGAHVVYASSPQYAPESVSGTRELLTAEAKMTEIEQSLSTDELINADPAPQVSSFKGGLQQYAFIPNSTPPKRRTPAFSAPAPTPSPLNRSHLKRKASEPASQPASTPSPSPSTSTSPASTKKAKRPPSSYAPPSKYAHLHNKLIDSLAPDLICVFIGVNPGLQTATAGHAYAHPSNLFWKLLHTSGCTPRRCRADEDRALPRLYGLGHTNLVARPTRDASELSRAEMDAGVAGLEAKIARCRPAAVCVVGKGIWESVWRARRGRGIRKEEFRYGWQGEGERMGGGEGWGGARVFVATSTSGLAAGMRLVEKEAVWRELGGWVEKQREERRGEGGGGEGVGSADTGIGGEGVIGEA